MFENIPTTSTLCEDVSIISISANPPKVSSKRPVRITYVPRVALLIITFHGPIPYSSDKDIPWNYGADVYYHGIKQDLLAAKEKVTRSTDPDVNNIVGTSKITRNGRVFSPEISPPKTVTTSVIIPVAAPANTTSTTHVISHVSTTVTESTKTRGKEILVEPVQTKAHS